jgi:putative phage-type endonuclease
MQQKSNEWYAARVGRVTASSAGAILCLDPNRGPEDVLRSMVREYHKAQPEFTGNQATEYGTFHEAGARTEYMLETGNQVLEGGFYTTDLVDWLGASPDGLIDDDGLLEIKCPYRLRDGAGEHKSINDQPHYYAQIQIQMLSTARDWCDFYQWAPHKSKIERVYKNDHWLAENIPKLHQFYRHYLSQLDNKAHLETKRKEINSPYAVKLLAEYDHVTAQIDNYSKRKKEIINDLVEIAKDRDALICGRKLTKVESAGSVSYAQVVKQFCPDVDLELFRGKPSVSWRLS